MAETKSLVPAPEEKVTFLTAFRRLTAESTKDMAKSIRACGEVLFAPEKASKFFTKFLVGKEKEVIYGNPAVMMRYSPFWEDWVSGAISDKEAKTDDSCCPTIASHIEIDGAMRDAFISVWMYLNGYSIYAASILGCNPTDRVEYVELVTQLWSLLKYFQLDNKLDKIEVQVMHTGFLKSLTEMKEMNAKNLDTCATIIRLLLEINRSTGIRAPDNIRGKLIDVACLTDERCTDDIKGVEKIVLSDRKERSVLNKPSYKTLLEAFDASNDYTEYNSHAARALRSHFTTELSDTCKYMTRFRVGKEGLAVYGSVNHMLYETDFWTIPVRTEKDLNGYHILKDVEVLPIADMFISTWLTMNVIDIDYTIFKVESDPDIGVQYPSLIDSLDLWYMVRYFGIESMRLSERNVGDMSCAISVELERLREEISKSTITSSYIDSVVALYRMAYEITLFTGHKPVGRFRDSLKFCLGK